VRALEGGLRRQGADLEQAAQYSLSDFTAVQSMAGLDRTSVLRALGQTSEKACDYEMAVGFYRHALAMEPTDPFIDYFVYNNLGYSLIQLSQFAEAEERCRQSIEIDPNRSNAHKNLGLALQGQGRFTEAGQQFKRALDIFNESFGPDHRFVAGVLL
jgi:tetratricopeptide (TPR) repeat protein